MLKQIELINRPIDDSLAVPGETTSLIQVYRTLSVQVHQLNQHVVFKVSVPLVLNKRYMIYKIIPVPTKMNLKDEYVTLKPEKEFIATTNAMDEYALLSRSELEECIDYTEKTLICKDVYHMSKEGGCEWSFLNNNVNISLCDVSKSSPRFKLIKLNTDNRWVYIAPVDMRVTTICGSSIKHHILSTGEGIIDLDAGCPMKYNHGQILSKKSYGNDTLSLTIPQVNIAEIYNDRSQVHLKNLTKNFHSNFSYIDEKIAAVKREQESLPYKISAHDAHHYGVIYILVAIILVYIMIRIKYRRMATIEIQAAQAPTPARHISMPNLNRIQY